MKIEYIPTPPSIEKKVAQILKEWQKIAGVSEEIAPQEEMTVPTELYIHHTIQ